MEAMILLGHGSRLTEANKTLKQMALMVKELVDIPIVEIAFLQFVKPDFFDAISACIEKGAKKIIIHPYFLYRGRHFEEDIAEMIAVVQKKYTDVEFVLTEPLGVHENIAMVVLERAMKNISPVKILKPHEIEEKSFEIITEELGETNFRDIELPIVKRVIHATGDFDYAKNLRFHPNAVEAGIQAIREGKNILVDVEMVRAGINKNILERYGNKVVCHLSESEVKEKSCALEKTRSEIAIELGAMENIGIVAIGNAPTALYKVMKLLKDAEEAGVQDFAPLLVIGVPVGFVKAVESKEVLLHMKYPFITSLGRKGDSSVAVAIVNALLKMAKREE
ncbi:MAG: precorrin-8X methylmutase [bacterium]